MIYKLFIASFSLLTLTTCQTQKEIKAKKQSSLDSNIVLQDSKDSPINSSPNKEETNPKTQVKESDESPQERIIYLKEGENKFLKEYEMNVTFKRVLEDSRCPKDVNCVWIGNAIAEIEVMGTYTRPTTLQISTTRSESRGFFQSQSFNGYKISLIELTPETTSAKGFNALKGSYKVALQFEKENGNAPTKNNGPTMK